MGFMDKLKEMFGTAKEQATPYVEKTKEAASEAAVKAKEVAATAAEKAAPYVEKTKDFASEAAEKVKDTTKETYEKAQAKMDDMRTDKAVVEGEAQPAPAAVEMEPPMPSSAEEE